MARRYKRRYKNNENDIDKIISVIIIFFVVGLIGAYNKNKTAFWEVLFGFIGLVIVLIIIFKSFKKRKEKAKKNRIEGILTKIQEAGLEEYINNFITRFGLGQEKNKNVWIRRNYKISWDRINDLRYFLYQKEIKLSPSDICTLLSNYIDKKEFNLTVNSITTTTNRFSELSGTDFESLLHRLYEVMGYSVQDIGKTGDQGGDLIATKGQERILIQAKCYKDWNVGNSAIQEAVAAKNHYDCNKAIVITTSNFTKEATELAKTNNVELISRNMIQKMLLDNLKESWS